MKENQDTGWVSEDGSYGVNSIILFDSTALTDKQWDILGELGDNSRYDYVQAIMNKQDLSEWEDDEEQD